jgi:UDP-N-acetylglucosamine diphosphorylase/glucosamine-1-phosphate N-acetyltransferase
MTALVLYDDAVARAFEPFALTRPVSELRAGTEVIRRRWETALGVRATGFVGAPHLAAFRELDAPAMLATDLPAGTIVAQARCAPALRRTGGDADVWTCDGRVAAVRLTLPVALSTLATGNAALESLAPDGARVSAIEGWWLDAVWHLVRDLGPMIAGDVAHHMSALNTVGADELGAAVLGAHPARVERGASLEPYVVVDASAGPVLVRRGATVAPFTRLVGPCYVGEDSTVAGGRVAGTAIGEQCRVHGEVSATVFRGHANKSHEGFVGHSYLGRWVNLGASTVTSNLKNTYGPVTMWTPRGMSDTGMQFLGTLFGDHVKTAIGTRLTTGSVIGAGANVFGPEVVPKVVAPFAWGVAAGAPPCDVDRFLAVAERMMRRRHVALGDREREWLSAAFAARWQVE